MEEQDTDKGMSNDLTTKEAWELFRSSGEKMTANTVLNLAAMDRIKQGIDAVNDDVTPNDTESATNSVIDDDDYEFLEESSDIEQNTPIIGASQLLIYHCLTCLLILQHLT